MPHPPTCAIRATRKATNNAVLKLILEEFFDDFRSIKLVHMPVYVTEFVLDRRVFLTRCIGCWGGRSGLGDLILNIIRQSLPQAIYQVRQLCEFERGFSDFRHPCGCADFLLLRPFLWTSPPVTRGHDGRAGRHRRRRRVSPGGRVAVGPRGRVDVGHRARAGSRSGGRAHVGSPLGTRTRLGVRSPWGNRPFVREHVGDRRGNDVRRRPRSRAGRRVERRPFVRPEVGLLKLILHARHEVREIRVLLIRPQVCRPRHEDIRTRRVPRGFGVLDDDGRGASAGRPAAHAVSDVGRPTPLNRDIAPRGLGFAGLTTIPDIAERVVPSVDVPPVVGETH